MKTLMKCNRFIIITIKTFLSEKLSLPMIFETFEATDDICIRKTHSFHRVQDRIVKDNRTVFINLFDAPSKERLKNKISKGEFSFFIELSAY